MSLSKGFSVLELSIGIGLTLVCMSIMIPALHALTNRWTQLRTVAKHQVQLDWICDQVCNDIQFSGTSTVISNRLFIDGSPQITYERVGTSLRRVVSGTTQTLSTVPIIGWEISPSGSSIAIKLASQSATVNRTCRRW